MREPSMQSNEKNPGCPGYLGDSTNPLFGDYNKPSKMENKRFFFAAQFV